MAQIRPQSAHTDGAQRKYESKQQRSRPQSHEKGMSASPLPGTHFRYHLNAKILRRAIEERILDPRAWPKEDINGRSRSDSFAKALALLQLVGFFTGIIARVAEELPVTQLEVSTSAFALCCIIPYAFIFNKPKDVETPVVLATCDEVPLLIRELKVGVTHDLDGRNSPLSDIKDLKDGRTFGIVGSPTSYQTDGLVICCFATLFGLIHLTAWNSHFPSMVDAWLWRSSATVITAAPLPCLAYWRFAEWMGLGVGSSILVIMGDVALFYLLLFSLFCGRMILIVEPIRTLFYLPPRAYLTPSWPAGIPHFS